MTAASTSRVKPTQRIGIGIACLVLCLPDLSRSQVPTSQEALGIATVSNFCQLDTDGTRLNSPGVKKIAKTLLVSERPWEHPSEIVIIRDYSVRPLTAQKSLAQFAADYRVLGRLDSALNLTRLQMPYAAQPPVQSDHFSLVLTDTHTELGPDGKQHQIKGPPEWRIKSYPSEPHVGINAAIAYVRKMGYGARDIATRTNAEKALSQLQEMVSQPAVSTQLAGPDAIVSQFIEAQMGGLTLEPDTSGQVSTLLVHPELQNRDKIGVARAYDVKNTAYAGNKATVSVEYGALGEIDSQLRYTGLSERVIVVKQDYKLLLDNKYSAPAYGDKAATEFVGPSRWRIDDTPPEQWVSVSTAIKYVTQTRDSTRDPAIKANADKTLAVLARYR